MTKLMQWLSVFGVYLAVWVSFFMEILPISVSAGTREVVLVSPIFILMSFACLSLGIIGYRVATFNDCTEASKELKKQILEAREDLQKKGFKFT